MVQIVTGFTGSGRVILAACAPGRAQESTSGHVMATSTAGQKPGCQVVAAVATSGIIQYNDIQIQHDTT